MVTSHLPINGSHIGINIMAKQAKTSPAMLTSHTDMAFCPRCSICDSAPRQWTRRQPMYLASATHLGDMEVAPGFWLLSGQV